MHEFMVAQLHSKLNGTSSVYRQFLHISACFQYMHHHLERQCLRKLYHKANSMSWLKGTEHAISFNILYIMS